MKNGKITACVLAVLLLFAAFWWGGNAPGLRGLDVSDTENIQMPSKDEINSETDVMENPSKKEKASETKDTTVKVAEEKKSEETDEQAPETAVYQKSEEKVTEGAQVEKNVNPVEKTQKSEDSETVSETVENVIKDEKEAAEKPDEEKYETTSEELTCTLSVRCDTILKNKEWIRPEKFEILPENGVIFPEQTVVFYEEETVFNILLREMKKNKIHMEFENIPVYCSAYIEGIGNLYEFDCGELSGWMYKVNGVFPDYGSSNYKLKKGDRVEWVYTCDFGADVGGEYAKMNGR